MSALAGEHGRRVLTALVGVGLIGSIYYFLGHLGLQVITAVIALVSYHEFVRMVLQPENIPAARTAKASVAVVAAVIFLLPVRDGQIWGLCLLMAYTLALYRRETDPRSLPSSRYHLNDLFASIFGLIYIVGFLMFLPKIHALEHGPAWILILLMIIWVGDSAAYYGGHLLGRNKLSAAISPGKTMEGAASGLIGSAIIAVVLQQLLLPHVSPLQMAFLGGITGFVSQIGDLFESMIKRVVAVKDSGTILPGHGGMLDRFDSLILAAPFYYYAIVLWIAPR